MPLRQVNDTLALASIPLADDASQDGAPLTVELLNEAGEVIASATSE
ncbi:MAG: hypothetical protein ACR2MA_06160 [Egibacteraceae bacterium]